MGADGAEATAVETETSQVAENANGEEEDEDFVPDEMPENAWFIPFGWPKQCPKTFYKGSDPEWQEFVALAKNQEKIGLVKSRQCRTCKLKLDMIGADRSKDELAAIIGTFMGSRGEFEQFAGKPLIPSRFWFDIDFPDGPPPEYERVGYVRHFLLLCLNLPA